jgi:hypothetical protein
MGFSGPVAAEGCQSSEGDGNSEEKAVKSHFPTRIQNLLPGSPPQHSTTVMDPLPPGVAYRRSPPRKPEFPMFPPPGRAKLPLSRKPSRRLSIFPRPQLRASPPPNLARSSSPSGTTRRNSCDGAPQLAQGAALRFVGYREFGLIVPRHPANPREVAGLAGGFTQSHRALGRSLPACRNRWARLFVKQIPAKNARFQDD